MARTAPLHDLQQVDTALDSRLARIKDIDTQTARNEAVEAARAEHDAANAVHTEAQQRLHRASHELEETTTRLRSQEKRLYDGSVKNPKELGQVQEEVEHLKVRFKTLEESMIEAMLGAEEASDKAQELFAALEAISQEWEQSKAGLLEERDKLLTQAKVLKVKRQRAITTIPWPDLQQYERLRRTQAGIAVVEVKGGFCGGCRAIVPAHVLRLARSGNDLVLCPTCGRILFPVGEIKFSEFDHGLDNVDR